MSETVLRLLNYYAKHQKSDKNTIVVNNLSTHSYRHLAVIFVLMGSLINSTGGLLLRSIDLAGPWHVIFYRQGALTLSLIFVLTLYYRGNLKQKFKGIGVFGIFAGFAMGIGSSFFILALSNTTVANTLFVLSAAPFVTAVIAKVFLKEFVHRSTWIAMSLALLGIIIMVGGGFAAGTVFGNVSALITVICFSTFVVLLRRGKSLNMMPAVVLGSSIATINAAVFLGGNFSISLHDLAICIFWGGLLSTIVHFIFVLSSKFLRGAELMLLVLVEFILGPLWVWAFASEVPEPLTLVGGAVVLSSVAGYALFMLSRENN